MKKRRSIIAFLLAAAMCGSLLGGCGKKDAKEADPGVTGEAEDSGDVSEDIVHLEMAVPIFGSSAPADAELIEEKINAVAEKEIGVNVNLTFYSLSDYDTQIPLILSGDEQLDCLVVFGDRIGSWIDKGYLQGFGEQLDKHGDGIKGVLGEDWLSAGVFDGEQYTIGVRTDLVEAISFVMRKDIVDKYSVDLSGIKSIPDLEKVLAVVKENEPDLVPIVSNDAQATSDYQYSIDPLFDGLGVLQTVADPGGTQIVNLYATDEYQDYCRLMHDWYQKGYIDADILTETENGSVLIKNGKAFGFFYPYKPYVENQETQLCGYEMACVQLTPPITSTTTLIANSWGIGRNCVDVDKAVEFYNLCYTNSEILNLLAWGIEGMHYELDENGQVELLGEESGETSGYNLGMGWLFFDNFGQYVAAGNPKDLYEAIDEFNKSASYSAALGFHWDSDEVKTEVATCTNVLQQYRLPLEYGLVDPDEVLPEFLEALKNAGIDHVIEAKQKQFDEWRAQNEG